MFKISLIEPLILITWLPLCLFKLWYYSRIKLSAWHCICYYSSTLQRHEWKDNLFPGRGKRLNLHGNYSGVFLMCCQATDESAGSEMIVMSWLFQNQKREVGCLSPMSLTLAEFKIFLLLQKSCVMVREYYVVKSLPYIRLTLLFVWFISNLVG